MDLAGEKAMMMSTTGAEKIREKIIQRRGNELLQRLDGLEAGALAKASDYDLSWHMAIAKENSAFKSKSTLLFPIDNFFEAICENFEKFTEKYEGELLIQYEKPFILKVDIRESKSFMHSLYKEQNTKDLVIFKIHPDAIFEVQELEYNIKLFIIEKSI